MNVFEDLVDALKEENLIERTVIEVKKADTDDEYLGAILNKAKFSSDRVVPPVKARDFDHKSESAAVASAESFQMVNNDFNNLETGFAPAENFQRMEKNSAKQSVENVSAAETVPLNLQKESKVAVDEKDFYRKRAMEEVSGLQMVEHVLSGIEREQMKTMPKLYNDISVKKALHDFLSITGDVKSSEHAQAEFQLMQETETWCSALSHRDKRVSVAHLRRYCETTKPALSSQALIALARFYRNLPFSESVRSKFDLIVTRLFTKEAGEEKRVLVFERDELIDHLKDLYADWSSIPLYSTDSDDSNIVLAAIKFEDFMTEAESASDFDELVKNDFFNRLRLFKESANELFYAPLVTATAIECNVRIGNKYIELIASEREKSSVDDLQEKYGFLHDQTISDATSKTFQLIDLLKEKTQTPAPIKKQSPPMEFSVAKAQSGGALSETKISIPQNTERSKKSSSLFAVNKWLLAATVIVVLLSGGVYYWVNMAAVPAANTNVKRVNLDNSSLKEHLQTARISGDTFYGVTLPTWDALTNEKREELLKKILQFGADKGFVKVHLVDKQGKSVGFANSEKAEVINP